MSVLTYAHLSTDKKIKFFWDIFDQKSTNFWHNPDKKLSPKVATPQGCTLLMDAMIGIWAGERTRVLWIFV
jgi:hypothetical protein